MASVNGRFLSSGSSALLYAVAGAVALVALFSFALSFNALAELAVAAHVPRQIAWAWPVVVDLSIIVGTFASLVLRGRASRAVRAYPWAILIVFGAVSIMGNGYHALTGGAPATPEVAFAVGAVPAVALLASTHLLVVMLTGPGLHVSDDDLVRSALATGNAPQFEDGPAPKPAAAAVAVFPIMLPDDLPVPPAPAPAPTRPTVRSAAVKPSPSPQSRRTAPATRSSAPLTRDQALTRVREHFTSTGEWLSGPEVGELMDVSRKTGSRVVAVARQELADA